MTIRHSVPDSCETPEQAEQRKIIEARKIAALIDQKRIDQEAHAADRWVLPAARAVGSLLAAGNQKLSSPAIVSTSAS